MRNSRAFSRFAVLALLVCSSIGIAAAQDLQQHVTYICNGQREFIENCNMRDLSDTSNCYVGHPDHILANGMMAYTNETRGSLKKLFPTCKQPSVEEIAKAKAFEKKRDDLYAAGEKKANDQLTAATQPVTTGQPQKPKTPEERAMARCITSGRLPATCTGNTLLGAFSDMVSQVLPSAAKGNSTGPNMAGVFEGPGHWRLDFIDGGVLVNCSFLSPNQQSYKLDFKNNRTAIIIDTTPQPLNLTLKADGTIVGPGPLKIDGVVAAGYTEGDSGGPSYSGGYHDRNGMAISNSQAASSSEVYDSTGNRVYNATSSGGAPGHTTFAPRTATCPAQNLTSKGASVGMQTMQTDLLKSMFNDGDKGPPTPAGIRMNGIFAASTGFSVQFFPESAILGCGPDAARAYPYTVVADGTKAMIKIAAPDHPLTLALNSDGSLDPGASGAYQVHGRTVTGQNDNDDFTFAPREETCNLGVLTPSKAIPSSGGVAAAATASAGGAQPGAAAANVISMPNAPLGNAVLTIISGFPTQPNAANQLANYPYVLLRDRFANAVANNGMQVPAGMSAIMAYASACGNHTPDCQKLGAVWKADAISAARADATGKAILPGVPPGTYYVAISTRYNNQPIVWDMRIDLKAGSNTITLDAHNAAPLK